jgi:hypothetical protein
MRGRETVKPEREWDDYEKFEEIMATIEGDGPQTTLFALLKEAGVLLPYPDDVTDADLSKVLWDVIHGLAEQGAFLSYTDHLSDRELYSTLWHETLREEHPIVPDDYPLMTHIDMLGGWSNEDIHNNWKYYADDEQRQRAMAEGQSLPDHVDPPYSRDHLLPG